MLTVMKPDIHIKQEECDSEEEDIDVGSMGSNNDYIRFVQRKTIKVSSNFNFNLKTDSQ